MTPKPFVGTQVDLAVAWESVPALQIDVGSWQRDQGNGGAGRQGKAQGLVLDSRFR